MAIDLLLQAEFASRFFSKIRLVIPTKEVDKDRYAGYVFEWPRSHKRNLPSENILKKLGLKIDSYYKSIDYYKYTHTEYEEMKTENNKLDYLRFKLLRNYFSIKRLENIPQEHLTDITISIGTRETILSEENLNTSNSSLVDSLKIVEDVEWLFNTYSTKPQFKLRIPGSYGPLIFNERQLFPDKQLCLVSRTDFGSQKNKDKRALSHLFVISSKDKGSFEKIANFSYSSLMQLVDDEQLFTRCSEILLEFEKEKIGM